MKGKNTGGFLGFVLFFPFSMSLDEADLACGYVQSILGVTETPVLLKDT